SLLAIALLLICTPAPAEIYKQVDAEGRVTYSNIPSKGAQKLHLEPLPSVPGYKAPAGTPGDFPKIDTDTQKGRDGKRRQLLESELEQEKKQLEDARQALTEGEATRLGDERNNYQKYLDRVQRLKDTIAEHEKNVDALQQELAGLR
ncbi:MAG TPA: DUF4124 domain-containing protein, partial [Burkholderiales bacterium]|nr:DUF4124 domain-containing protein [Burkholderiales bacterium]